MTENDAIEELITTSGYYLGELTEPFQLAIQALEEIRQYRAIGTIDEFKALKEKMQDVEITIINRMQEFCDVYKSTSQSEIDYYGGKADAIETSQKIVKGVFKDILGIDWE